MAISKKTPEEIEILAEGGKRLAHILSQILSAVRPGISTKDLDTLAEKLIRGEGGIPVFKGYKTDDAPYPFPASICASLESEVVHGIPKETKVIKEGETISIDIGMRWPDVNGLVTDMASTIAVGTISKDADRLLRTTREALDAGIRATRPGARIGDVGSAIEKVIRREKFGIVHELAGHGVGFDLHEDPFVPNFGRNGTGIVLEEGMVLALEPIVTLGSPEIELEEDGWTYRTKDGSLAAHFEHTIALTRQGTQILTDGKSSPGTVY